MIKSRTRWAEYVACTGYRTGAHMVLVGKPERKRPFGRPRCRWEDIFEMHLQE
jgi:hypothetical protein